MRSKLSDTRVSFSAPIAVCTSVPTPHTLNSLSPMSSDVGNWGNSVSPDLRRRVILNLSQVLLQASCQRRDLSPILLEALYHALDQLLHASDRMNINLVEEWLLEELLADKLPHNSPPTNAATPDTSDHDILKELGVTSAEATPPGGTAVQERRFCERRFGERRVAQLHAPKEVEDRRHLSDRRCTAGRRQEDQPENAGIAATAEVISDLNGDRSITAERSTQDRSTPGTPSGSLPVKQAAADGASRLHDATISALLSSILLRN